MPVRDATPEDVDEVCALIEEHARYEGNDELKFDRAEMAGHLFGDDTKAWVVLVHPEGQPQTVAGFGFCSWNFSTWQARPGIWMDDLFVRPQFRRGGMAGELLDELKSRTSGRVEWEMQTDNDKGKTFYARLGANPVPGWIRYRWV